METDRSAWQGCDYAAQNSFNPSGGARHRLPVEALAKTGRALTSYFCGAGSHPKLHLHVKWAGRALISCSFRSPTLTQTPSSSTPSCLVVPCRSGGGEGTTGIRGPANRYKPHNRIGSLEFGPWNSPGAWNLGSGIFKRLAFSPNSGRV